MEKTYWVMTVVYERASIPVVIILATRKEAMDAGKRFLNFYWGPDNVDERANDYRQYGLMVELSVASFKLGEYGFEEALSVPLNHREPRILKFLVPLDN